MPRTRPKIGTVFLDFMQLIPTLTHFLDPKKLRGHFGFLLDPRLFHSEYLTQVTEEHPRRHFVHRLGSLRPLAPPKWRYPFWRNLFGSTSLRTYISSYLEGEGYFGYLPYIIRPSWRIGIEPSSKTGQPVDQILSRAKVALTARLFPMGAASIHLMAFFASEQAEVDEFVEIQKMLLRHRSFRVTRRRSTGSQLLSLEEIFENVQNLAYDSLYTERPRGEPETRPGLIHRIIYSHLLQADGMTSTDVQLATASLIGLKTLEKHEEAKSLLRRRATFRPKDPDDLLIFHPMATLLYAPKCKPHKDGYCLWNNYINVVELATLQNFILRKANDLLPKSEFHEFADHVSSLEGLAHSHQSLRGGHKGLYREIDQELELSKTAEMFSLLLKSRLMYQSYEEIINQIQRIEETLRKMQNVADSIQLSIKQLLVEADGIRTPLAVNVETLKGIEERQRKRTQLPQDTAEKRSVEMVIQGTIYKYGTEFLPHCEQIIDKFLKHSADMAKIDVSNAKKKLERAKPVPPYTHDSVPAFVKDAKEYVKALLDAAAEGLVNIP